MSSQGTTTAILMKKQVWILSWHIFLMCIFNFLQLRSNGRNSCINISSIISGKSEGFVPCRSADLRPERIPTKTRYNQVENNLFTIIVTGKKMEPFWKQLRTGISIFLENYKSFNLNLTRISPQLKFLKPQRMHCFDDHYPFRDSKPSFLFIS